ncbi:hypothetical protein [Streptomyces sp. NPDC056169]|uniref:hypothetical protein n=1 Tax=Streptomyces sp. NPDC056169 TaxID=3345734 RepID=UPI0035E10287
MTSPLGRRADRSASLLLLFLLAGASALARGPARWKLRKIATSDEVRRKRQRAEHELRARAEEIGRSGPWGPALRTTLVDSCTRGGARNLFDRNAPKQPAMSCTLRLHLYFVVDRPVPDIVGDLRSMTTPAVWSEDSIRAVLRYYETEVHASPHTYPPSVGSLKGGEQLSWDAPGDNVRAKVAEPRPGRRKAVLGTCASDPADVTLRALRERPGTLFAWTLTTGYHTVQGTR